jgi:hypothetical protein
MAKKDKAAASAPAISDNETFLDPAQDQPTKKAASSPNDELDLDEFNYESLTGENFKEYVRLVGDRSYTERNDEGKYVPVNGSLLQNDKYDFILLPAVPVMVERFPGMKDTPIDYIGIKAKTLTPIHRTRIPVSTALEYNAQIVNQHSRAGHGKYYFLAKK